MDKSYNQSSPITVEQRNGQEKTISDLFGPLKMGILKTIIEENDGSVPERIYSFNAGRECPQNEPGIAESKRRRVLSNISRIARLPSASRSGELWLLRRSCRKLFLPKQCLHFSRFWIWSEATSFSRAFGIRQT